jgi:hypothetical protein
MSGGGGGTIIINRIAEGPPISIEDRGELREIAARSIPWCSHMDSLRVLFILWKYLRS